MPTRSYSTPSEYPPPLGLPLRFKRAGKCLNNSMTWRKTRAIQRHARMSVRDLAKSSTPARSFELAGRSTTLPIDNGKAESPVCQYTLYAESESRAGNGSNFIQHSITLRSTWSYSECKEKARRRNMDKLDPSL